MILIFYIGVGVRNILIIGIIVVSIGYMFVIMKNKYDDMEKVNAKIEKQNAIKS